MKNTFPGYFQPSEQDFQNLWDTCLFTVDANILLNLYRYSENTKNEVLRLLNVIKDRLWLTHQAAHEYLNNKLQVISEQERIYDDVIKSINALLSNIKNESRHPFVTNQTFEKLNLCIKDVISELNANREIHINRISNDEVLSVIEKLFLNKIGLPLPEEQLSKLLKDGKKRYSQKTPPGYKDINKSSKGNQSQEISELPDVRVYGDLVLWFELIEKSKTENRSIIFVTDDKKEDWWSVLHGKTLGPRPELVNEFCKLTNQNFYMYQSDRFLELTSTYLNFKLKNEIVDEVRDIRKDEIERVNAKEYLFEEAMGLRIPHPNESLIRFREIESGQSALELKYIKDINAYEELLSSMNPNDPAHIEISRNLDQAIYNLSMTRKNKESIYSTINELREEIIKSRES